MKGRSRGGGGKPVHDYEIVLMIFLSVAGPRRGGRPGVYVWVLLSQCEACNMHVRMECVTCSRNYYNTRRYKGGTSVVCNY